MTQKGIRAIELVCVVVGDEHGLRAPEDRTRSHLRQGRRRVSSRGVWVSNASSERGDRDRVRVLLVDDSALMRQVARRLLA